MLMEMLHSLSHKGKLTLENVQLFVIVDHMEEKYDENVEKKHLSMTPTNPKSAQPVLSSKKNSFVSGSKNAYE